MVSSDFDSAYQQLTDARAANHQAYVAFQQATQDGETQRASTLQHAELDRQAVVGWADQALRTVIQALDEGRSQLLAVEISPAGVQLSVPVQREAESARTGLDQAQRQASGALAALNQAKQRLLDIRAVGQRRRQLLRRIALVTIGAVTVVGLVTYSVLSRSGQNDSLGGNLGLSGMAGAQPTSRSLKQTPASSATAPTAHAVQTEPQVAGSETTLAPGALTPQPAVRLAYDDFTRITTGWAPLYMDQASNFNGYNAGAYLFDVVSPNGFFYDIRTNTRLGAGRYAVDVRYSYGDGSFGFLLDVQGDPNVFKSLSYYGVGITSAGAVVLQRREVGDSTTRTVAEAPPASVRLSNSQTVHVEVDATSPDIRVLIDGAEILRAPGVQLQGGGVGFYVNSGGQPLRVAFDNMLWLEGSSAQQAVCAAIRPLFAPSQGTALLQGDDVRVLQQRLTQLGYDVGAIDGTFGPASASATMQFQQRNGLTSSGVVDPQTWCRLLSSDAITVEQENAERLVVQQSYRAVGLSLDARLDAPLLVSVRQADKSWRIALALPGRSELLYIETEGDAMDASWSPDNRFLAFTSERSGVAAVWLLDRQSGELRQITPAGVDCQFPAWAPDARALLYTAQPQPNEPQSARDYIFDLDTGQTRLLSDGQAGWADWSIAGEIVFTHWTGKSFDLFRANRDGSGLVNLSNTDNVDEDIPAWSPDGKQIMFVSSPRRDTKQRQIFVMQRDGSGTRQLTNISGPNSNPVWSFDSQKLVFANQPADGVWQPWLIDITGANPRRLSGNEDRIWFMNWSPHD